MMIPARSDKSLNHWVFIEIVLKELWKTKWINQKKVFDFVYRCQFGGIKDVMNYNSVLSICSSPSICFLKASRPATVAKKVVLGFLPINCFCTLINSSCSSAERWLARFPSVNSRVSLSVLKSIFSFTISNAMIPRRIRLSNALLSWRIGLVIVDFGLRIADCGLWISDFGLRIVDFGLPNVGWILDLGFWILVRQLADGSWILDFGSWVLDSWLLSSSNPNSLPPKSEIPYSTLLPVQQRYLISKKAKEKQKHPQGNEYYSGVWEALKSKITIHAPTNAQGSEYDTGREENF